MGADRQGCCPEGGGRAVSEARGAPGAASAALGAPSTAGPSLWRVVPLVAVRTLGDRTFDYLEPEDLEACRNLSRGRLVKVPFGRRMVTGVVVGEGGRSAGVDETQAATPGPRLRRISGLLPGVLDTEGMQLAEAMARYFCAPLGAAFIAVSAAARVAEGAGRGRTQAWILPHGRAVPTDALTRRQKEILASLPPEGMPVTTACRVLGCTRGLLNALVSRGVAELEMRASVEVSSRPHAGEAARGRARDTMVLTAEQQRAYVWLEAALQRRRFEHALLWGVTGSGKTEVYLRLLRALVASEGQALVLVPEIALTASLQRYLEEGLGPGQVVVVHSAMTAAARARAWRVVQSGEARVVVGPRSAAFAPLSDLRLVIIDESHDPSFKNEEEPRYHARWVARWRAQHHGALLLEGTATPRLETLVESRKTLRLRGRPTGAVLPAVEIIDMRRQGGGSILSPRAASELRRTVAAATQAVVLVNRRGLSAYLFCPECGRVVVCPRCDISLTLHRVPGRTAVGGILVCHHCGSRQVASAVCSACGAALARGSAGTQALEEELRRFLPPQGIFRLDSDAAEGGKAASTLEAFASSAPGVLLGTQMVAKGHDFPQVTLVIVADADSSLYMPDFRAAERTFHLIRQVAGRAGRREAPGKALVQTWNPDSPCIRMAVSGDETGFFRRELEERRRLGFPPATRMVRIVVAGVADRIDRAAQLAAQRLGERCRDAGATYLGPSRLPRLRGAERRQLLVLMRRDQESGVTALREVVFEVRAALAQQGIDTIVDADPEWFV